MAVNNSIQPDDAKLAELILYIADQLEDDPSFGATKINKILFVSDFTAYVHIGQPITGQVYQKETHGPVCKRFLPIFQQLEKQGHAATRIFKRYGMDQKRPVALRDANLSSFSGEEIAIVDNTVTQMRGLSATAVSEWSHDFVGWQAAKRGEEIPYVSVFVAPRRALTAEEEKYSRQLAEETGLDTSEQKIPF